VLKSVKVAAQKAFKMAGITADDIDVAEVHDAFEILEIAESEDIGFFEKGKGHLAVEKGLTALDGKLPINPSGGLKARGHALGATGVAQVVELVWQLRGECGERQVKDPKRGFSVQFRWLRKQHCDPHIGAGMVINHGAEIRWVQMQSLWPGNEH
jgi:acetyl-CoA C-acetyltransferase